MKTVWKIIGRLGGWVLWLPVWVVIRFTTRTRVLVICQDEVLVLQGWLSTGRWSFPGGGKHRNEAPIDAVKRELQEETGIVAKDAQLTSLGLKKKSKGQPYDYYAFALELAEKPELHLQKIEIMGARWLPTNQLEIISTEPHVRLLLDTWRKQR